jgi:amino acid permease
MGIDFNKRRFGGTSPSSRSEDAGSYPKYDEKSVNPATFGGTLPDGAAVEVGDAQLDRGLSQRHLNFIAIGGTIGTGFFLSSGTALAKAGPVGCLISYVFIGTVLWSVMVSLSEMATYIPTAGAFSVYATRFVDPALGFALGWLYWFSCMSPPSISP